jgi:flavin-dependent dehydrogenase
VLVVGAGPAGGELARLLSCRGIDVLLIDQLADLTRAAFSSAALPLEALDGFGLPAAVVASRWSRWQLIGPGGEARQWQAPHPLGVVLDFGALREWLAQECRQWGAQVRLGLRALSCRERQGRMITLLRDRHGLRSEVESGWVVDATGQSRGLLGEPPPGGDGLVRGVGVEWLLRVPPATWECWSDRLSFALGSDWVNQGYGWVFPMQRGRLKLGVCRLQDPRQPQPPLGGVLQRMLERLLPADEAGTVEILDRHGGLISSTIARREPHRRGRLIGLGDAVSTANLLGGEGIRHALTSSRVLAPLLLEALEAESGAEGGGGKSRSGSDSLDAYPNKLRKALGWRWTLSGRLARRTWLGLRDSGADQRLERLLEGLQGCRAEDLSALLFRYRFERYGMRALPYLLGMR